MAKQSIPSVRLNANMRRMIVAGVVEKTIWPQYRKLKSQLDQIIEQIRLESVGGAAGESKLRSIIDRLNRMQKEAEEIAGKEARVGDSNLSTNFLRVNMRGMQINLHFCEAIGEFPGMHWDSLSIKGNQKYANKVCFSTDYNNRYVVKSDELIDAYFGVTTKLEKLGEELKSVALTVRGTVDSVNTLGKLRETWPECEEYLPAGIENPTQQMKLNLPVSIDALNKRLTALKQAA